MQSAIDMITGVLLLEIISSSTCEARNFECTDSSALQIAEQSRLRSSTFWTGEPLRKSWAPPCHLTLDFANHTGGWHDTIRVHGTGSPQSPHGREWNSASDGH
ncbi:hypothetical protein KOR42_44810 [Thalassoglobus neptunius]|uniref:Uncharacterized protein n=1 Tax=Thalassoglobus neptunius TaxID=1938619 RepID=A0A5C5VYM7_9PLAN|nr:hypothetical protein [Thalassoglobus neptunius]TWT43540.1 hypothetical protein KOR42_44810 [Thalassoglobus neptunius]